MGTTVYHETSNPRLIGKPLTLRQEPGGWRHCLDGKAVHCGDGLYVCIADQWLPTRYEARWVNGQPEARIVLQFPCAGGHCQREIQPPSMALFCWTPPATGKEAAPW